MRTLLNLLNQSKTKPKFNILIGVPGTGKTTYAKKYLIDNNTEYLSSDDIRVELFGFEDLNHNDEVFNLMKKRAKSFLAQGKNVVYDATNISKKRRMALIREIGHKSNITINAYLFCMPINMILENNLVRTERFLEYGRLISMIRTLDVPMYYEGFDNIYLINQGLTNDIYSEKWFMEKASNYKQDNPYHNATLGEHTKIICDEIQQYRDKLLAIDYWILKDAALYHDFGKLYTRVYNEQKKWYSYYNHEKISTYLWCCHIVQHNLTDNKLRYRITDSNYQVAVLIAHHMDFYKGNLEKTTKILNDDDLLKMLNYLHIADEVRR